MLSGLELAAIGIAAVLVCGVLIYLGVRWLVVRSAGMAQATQRVDDLEAQDKRRQKADEVGAKPFPTNEEMDAWDRLEK